MPKQSTQLVDRRTAPDVAMADLKVRYLVIKPGRNGTKRYFWQPSKALRALGWEPVRLDGQDAATEGAIVDKANRLNAQLDAWRAGQAVPGAKAPPPVAPAAVPNTVANLIRLYKAHRRYKDLAESTRKNGYDWALRIVEAWAGDVQVKAITKKMVQEFYEEMLEAGQPAKANAIIRVLRVLLQFAVNQGLATENPAEKPGLVGTEPRLRIWTNEEIDVFVETAEELGWPSVGDAVIYGVYLGQRQGDLLDMKEIEYQEVNGVNRLRRIQRKSISKVRNRPPSRVDVRGHPRVEARVTAERARRRAGEVKAPTILWNDETKRPWVADTFRHVFAEVRAAAAKKCPSLLGYTGEEPEGTPPAGMAAWFMDSRDTAVTKLAEAGSTIPEICAITGHDPDSAYKVLKHYLALNGDMADAAIAKLVAHEERQRNKQRSNH